MTKNSPTAATWRNLIGFWFLGMCNHYVYTIMLSAAEDIIDRYQDEKNSTSSANQCETKITGRHCEVMSTGTILLADIIPSFLVRLTFPFFAHRLPYGFRHFIVVLSQSLGLLTVAFSTRIEFAIIGVLLASFNTGLGEVTYLALTSHFSGKAIESYAAGTGAAGIFSALAYSLLTEPHLANVSPKTALLMMSIMPVVFCFVYWFLMQMPDSVDRMVISDPKTFIVKDKKNEQSKDENVEMLPKGKEAVIQPAVVKGPLTLGRRFRLILPLMRYMIPLFLVYYGEYLINQGILQMIVFNCSNGLQLSAASQYRWYQVTYQLGVLISRTSVFFCEIPSRFLPVLAGLQLCNVAIALTESIFSYVPHIWMVFVVILYEGLLGGLTYANAMHAIHKEVPTENREFSLSIASAADSTGIVLAAVSALPVHNFICGQSIHAHRWNTN